MPDMFDVNVAGYGFHITSHTLALVALIVACFAITGYITFRDDTISMDKLEAFGEGSISPQVTEVARNVVFSRSFVTATADTLQGQYVMPADSYVGFGSFVNVGAAQLPNGLVLRFGSAPGLQDFGVTTANANPVAVAGNMNNAVGLNGFLVSTTDRRNAIVNAGPARTIFVTAVIPAGYPQFTAHLSVDLYPL